MNFTRRAVVHVLNLLMTFFGLNLALTGNQARADRAACDQIKAACKNAGFVLSGGDRNGLLRDCFQPIVQGTAQPSASRPLPKITPQLLGLCREASEPASVELPAGAPLVPAADGQTVYDPNLKVTWLADGNLARKQTFGVSNINKSGSMDYATAVRWVEAMNKADGGRGYLGQRDWQLPETGLSDPSCSMKGTTGFDCTGSALGALFYKQLGLHRGETAVAAPDIKVGPFHDIEPYLYWACEGKRPYPLVKPLGPPMGSSGISPLATASRGRISRRTIRT
jgi:hypothetical protein